MIQQNVQKTETKNEEIVKLVDITKRYKMGETMMTAIDGINLTIRRGEFVLIFGPSGSGKTTLLNQIGGIDVPDSGQVFLDGVDITRLSGKKLTHYRAKVIGWVFQFFNLIPSLNATENVGLALELSKKRDSMDEKARAILAKLGLEKFVNHFPSQLSGGQQQRVSIARALVKEPDIIIADEPTGNLDHKTGLEVIELMKQINKEQGITFVVVSHDPSLREIADRILYLQDGKIIREEAR